MSLSYTHVQSTPALTWTITHNLSGATMGDVIEDDGGVIRKILPASVKHITDDSMLVEFSEPTKGLVRLIGLFVPTTGTGVNAVDPGAGHTTIFDFTDGFVGSAGSLDSRVSPGDTRAWSELAAGLNLDGSGHLVNDDALLYTAPTIRVPLATTLASGLSIEVVFASPLQSEESVTGMTFDVSGTVGSYNLNFIADLPTLGDLTIQVGGADTNADYVMPMPASNTPFTVRVDLAGGVHTLFVNGSQVATGTISTPLGVNVQFTIGSAGSDLAADSVLVDSVTVEQLAGTLL